MSGIKLQKAKRTKNRAEAVDSPQLALGLFAESPLPAPGELAKRGRPQRPSGDGIAAQLAAFKEFGEATKVLKTSFTTPDGGKRETLTYVNEYWTARQRQASSLHEVSYRACFKPQLPRFFIERLTDPGDLVYDPFMGRGTTPIETALMDRVPVGNDINPLSIVMTRPRLAPPTEAEIAQRLESIPLDDPADMPDDLLVFYHPETLRGISSLKHYIVRKRKANALDALDEWIELVALNRLTGHSNGFFSVYTLPPNQAVSVASQRKINEKRKQTPPPRDIRRIILKKSRQLLGDVTPGVRETLARAASKARLFTGPADATPGIRSNSVALVVTSPPFLNVVQYDVDNWLRCWFLGFNSKKVSLTMPKKIEDWQAAMTPVFKELHRVLKPGGHVAFEVGEVHQGATRLEEAVLPCGISAGLEPLLVMVNQQEFTKTANCWGIDNMNKGTNTNRIVLFRKS
jgi:hypothetical protein